MPGLVPGIHVFLLHIAPRQDVGGRDKPGHDDEHYGRIVMLVASPGVRSGSASLANSHSRERVLRGSMISSTQNFSAERSGERSLFRRFSISCSFAFGSSAASMSAR